MQRDDNILGLACGDSSFSAVPGTRLEYFRFATRGASSDALGVGCRGPRAVRPLRECLGPPPLDACSSDF